MPVHAVVLSHREGSESPHSRAAQSALKTAGLAEPELTVDVAYLIEWNRDETAAQAAAELLADPVLETASVFSSEIPASGPGTQLTVMRQPGVMDPAEVSILRTLKQALIPAEAVRVAHVYRFPTKLDASRIAQISQAIANQAVESVSQGAVAVKTLRMGRDYQIEIKTVQIRGLDDDALMALSVERGLSMNLPEMQAAQAWFAAAGREPTDIELDMLAQTWSEHCKHKTLTGPVVYRELNGSGGQVRDSLFELAPEIVSQDGRINGILQSTIKRATEELDRDFCWSVFEDNAGVIDFDGTDGVCIKVETHNHPSAIEPYGGAGTGIGGVIRDILGTGLGAKPIANTDVFCFGYPSLDRNLVPKGSLHPLTVMRGVVSGVRDYGNRMGIPTVNGAVLFDERYTGNPLVYAGSIGLLPKKKVKKAARPGDAIVAIGGRTGRDGIGGATFSSMELTEESETVSSGAVQIGNAIQEKIVLDVMLQCRDRDLYSALTDCGAGGFSSAVGEMGEKTGARVELTNAPLKYAGLSYAEIWLSEAQERLVFAVPQEHLAEFLAICEAEDCEACVLGEFTDDGQMVVQYGGQTVLDLPMSFLHDGLPKVERTAEWSLRGQENPDWLVKLRALPEPVSESDHGAVLRAILAAPNVCSKEWVIRQYDHEVQAMSAVKPLTGVHNDGPSDGAALVPKPDGKKALVIACGLNPRYGDLDPYWMAMSAIDEAVRNAVCTGGDVNHTAILDNFSWGNCAKADRLGGLVRAAVGCWHGAMGLRTPFISGKDSLNNEFRTEEGTVAIPPTLLVTALSVTKREWLTTMDLKQAGSRLYIIGLTANEFGGSHYCMVTGKSGGTVPNTNPALALRCYTALNKAQAAGLVMSAHDCSEGGLAVALAEMAFAGGLGAEIALTGDMGTDEEARNDLTLLFAESNQRIVIEVPEDSASGLEKLFKGLPLFKLGQVTDSGRLVVSGISGEQLLNEDIEELRQAWKQTLYTAVGEPVPADTWARV